MNPNIISDKFIGILKSNRFRLKFLIIWCGFHLFALLMASTQIDIFNKGPRAVGEKLYPYNPKEKFWPIVKFLHTEDIIKHSSQGNDSYIVHHDGKEYYFNGIFLHYDWTEFAFYIGCSFMIFLLLSVNKLKH